jgi:hypothetical protein
MLHFLLIILVAVVIWRLLRGGGVSNDGMFTFGILCGYVAWRLAKICLIALAVILVIGLAVVVFVQYVLPQMGESAIPIGILIGSSLILLCVISRITR